MDHAWVIDELAYAGPEHLDPGYVNGYDRKQGLPSFDEDLQVMRDRGALDRHSTVVDLGAGTGRFALAAAAQCQRVVAVDVSAPMLAHVRARAADAEASNIECVQAGFLSYQHAGEPADAVFSRNALHHLPDFWKGIALHRVAQLMRPGGVLRLSDLVYDFMPADATTVLERRMSGAADDAEVGYTRDDLALHVRTEFSTYSWLLDKLIEHAGFDVVDRDVGAQVFATYTCVRR